MFLFRIGHMQDSGCYHFICYFSENSVLLLIVFTLLLRCHISSSCAISMYNLHESQLALVICDVNLSSPPLIVEFPNQMFNKTARCLLFLSTHIPEAFFPPLLGDTCEIEFEYTGFSGHKEVVDWSDCKLFLVQHLVFLYRAPGRH